MTLPDLTVLGALAKAAQENCECQTDCAECGTRTVCHSHIAFQGAATPDVILGLLGRLKRLEAKAQDGALGNV